MEKLKLDTIYAGNCIDVMSSLPEKSVDMIFADPPYNLQLHKDLHRPDSTLVDAVHDGWDKFESFESYDTFTRQWLTAARRLLKDDGTLWVIGSYHNIFRVGACVQDLGFWILNDIIWNKTNPMPNFKGRRFTNAHETLIWCAKSPDAKYTFNYESMKIFNDDLQMRSDWNLPICLGKERLKDDGGKKVHTTQKPESLLYRILLASTKPNDVVLDPFFGTGTTGAVAQKLSRHYIGIEQEPAYIQAARKRLANVQQVEMSLVDPTIKAPQQRIPFGSLLEMDLIHAGDKLRNLSGKITATVCADGALVCGSERASIHQLAAKLAHLPSCNGWTFWYLENGQSLDDLRQKAIALLQTGKKLAKSS